MSDFKAQERVLLDIFGERRRQMTVEGWTTSHDDQHGNGEMAGAAASYAVHSMSEMSSDERTRQRLLGKARALWPWEEAWFKPKDRRRNLVRAAALLIAEIERLDRGPKQAPALSRFEVKPPSLSTPSASTAV